MLFLLYCTVLYCNVMYCDSARAVWPRCWRLSLSLRRPEAATSLPYSHNCSTAPRTPFMVLSPRQSTKWFTPNLGHPIPTPVAPLMAPSRPCCAPSQLYLLYCTVLYTVLHCTVLCCVSLSSHDALSLSTASQTATVYVRSWTTTLGALLYALSYARRAVATSACQPNKKNASPVRPRSCA
jgi:hypothetical protein